MGIFTVYDILTGNPGYIRAEHINKKLYSWQNKVRAVLENGSVSKIGEYNLEGTILCKGTKKSAFNLFPKKEEYQVIDGNMIDYKTFDGYLFEDWKNDGFLINNKVYNMLKKHKNYKKCIKDKNLYELLLSFIPKKKKSLSTHLVGMQEVYIPDDNNQWEDAQLIRKNLWTLTDPDVKNKRWNT
jgi:hypothetical protein